MKDNDFLDGKDDFIIFTPGCLEIDLTKSAAEIEATRPIGGTCSTERLDRQDESVLAKGLDFSEFVHHGFFNDNHKQDTACGYAVTMAWQSFVKVVGGLKAICTKIMSLLIAFGISPKRCRRARGRNVVSVSRLKEKLLTVVTTIEF